MSSIIVKRFEGYSGGEVLLMQDLTHVFIRKIGNISRNIERLNALRDVGINIPHIITITDNYYDMEYIAHTNMVSWLLHNQVGQFTSWIIDCIENLKKNSVIKNWTKVYEDKLAVSSLAPFWCNLNFTASELISKLPIYLPTSHYHGDLTMDNCIYGANGKFYLIDPITTEYTSWVFDLAKLMQDLESGWFIRDKDVMLQGKLWSIKSSIINAYPEVNNPYLLILMLLRVLPYTKNDRDQQFIIKEINRLYNSV